MENAKQFIKGAKANTELNKKVIEAFESDADETAGLDESELEAIAIRMVGKLRENEIYL